MKKIINLINKYHIYLVLMFLVLVSFFSFLYFFQNGEHLLYGDAVSRLNISRKIVDNLTPGIAQIGNVWLPLPQLLMVFLIGNNFLWHSGIAGSIVSMSAFIIGGLYLYKSLRIISNSFVASVLALSVYALNINLLYLQTTAMSESIFLCSMIIAIYYFMLWIKSGVKIQYLIFAGVAVSAATLIRYEALAILALTLPMVFIYLYIRTKSFHRAEGSLFMYSLVACLGFGIWTVYLWAIFGDPLFWKNYYVGTHVVGDAATELHTYTFNLNLVQAFWKYTTTVVWMNGLLPTIMAIIAIPILFYESFKNRTYYFVPVLLSFGILAFMVLTLQKNTPINQPALTIANILSPTTSKFLEFNIRYGILMLPMLSLLSVYLFKSKYSITRIFLICILSIQFISYIYPSYTIIYNLPSSLSKNITWGGFERDPMTKWLSDNYDGGLIFISALKHDPQMFQLGLNYKTYIHEGTDSYWKTSIKNPQKYATWIVFDANNIDDQVTKYLSKFNSWKRYYNHVYGTEGVQIYKIKTEPEKQI